MTTERINEAVVTNALWLLENIVFFSFRRIRLVIKKDMILKMATMVSKANYKSRIVHEGTILRGCDILGGKT